MREARFVSLEDPKRAILLEIVMKNKFKIGDPTTFLVEFEGHAPRAVERKFEMQCVDTAHHGRRRGELRAELPRRRFRRLWSFGAS